MKRLLVLVVIPLMLFALERVNLIKNHSLEREDSCWRTYTGTLQPLENDSAVANAHDSGAAFEGLFSASGNTRSMPGDPTPPGIVFDSAVVIQGFQLDRVLGDLDSLCWMMKIIPPVVGYNYLYEVFMGMLLDAGNPDVTWAIYRYYKPSQSLERLNSYGKMYIEFTLSDDTSWIEWKRSVKTDWVINRGLSTNLVLDSIYLVSYGSLQGGWFGQKVYIDNIRLTGYADYDVGIKGILSGDSVWKNTGYTPTARIKNFGRKPADSFLVIAEIKNGVNIVYSDTMPYFLPADTEDTVSFKEFTPPDASNYTLTVSTLMTPDESDEDDEMSKTLYGSGIEEQPIPSGLAFEVSSFTPSPRVSYSIPAGQQGTISLYDPSGRRIESYRVQGEGQVAIKAGLSSGVYFVKLETGKANLTRKAVVLH